jgi:formylglycine-generating enzyme required for sulfatase activity
MVLVEGAFCPFVAHRCAEWLGSDEIRCQRYRPDLICEGRPSLLRFCIDRYEYPNMPGVLPVVMVDYFEAERACQVEGKRLCEAEEWTFACEGKGTWPYPYGLVRDPGACHIDRDLPEPDLRSFARPREVSVEVERLDQRVPSGSRPGCVSPFGVYDLTGNVDEWVHNRRGDRGTPPYDTGLKGGHFGPVQARCRPMTTSHNGWFRFYQAGFRCCASPSDGAPPRRTLPRKVRLPRRQTMPPPTKPPAGLFSGPSHGSGLGL